MKRTLVTMVLAVLVACTSFTAIAQQSVAHKWNEVNLSAIRNDFARPTVHARNLWHASILMYDCYAAFDQELTPFFLGDSLGNHACPFDGMNITGDTTMAQQEAMSYAMYRLLRHRYANSPQPGRDETYELMDSLMAALGYNPMFNLTDYTIGSPAALGNYIAQEMISAGYQDGANEAGGYGNQYYNPVNEDIFMAYPGNPDITDMNRWQPLSVVLFFDQSCNPWPFTPPFLSPEWGNVVPFALDDSVKTVKIDSRGTWNTYHDPGAPPYWDSAGTGLTEEFRDGFKTVMTWSSHLDPSDSVMWDISPASIGNMDIDDFPTNWEDYEQFYDQLNGGDPSLGHAVNPKTGMPYAPQIVPRGDYARVLAEFWADGPDSETPPGHWFSIYNEVSHHPEFTWKWEGHGDAMDQLAYDIRAYFTLGGALHDAAITAWSVKGYYDYVRPLSAIRAMCDLGQCSDSTLMSFHPGGISLEPGYIELVLPGDSLAGSSNEHVGKIKMNTWLGPIVDDSADPCIQGNNYVPITAGVGWKLAEEWWPYQRPTFVSPNFAGYVSGHSTFSRAAAEVMTFMTGDEFFPGGMGEFHCPQNDFLVFEEGPSVDLTLQWATYRDASDQTSLSRIWGGIHPPADDIPGRRMGEKVGKHAFALAQQYFDSKKPIAQAVTLSDNLITDVDNGDTLTITIDFDECMNTDFEPAFSFAQNAATDALDWISGAWISDSSYLVSYVISDTDALIDLVELTIDSARDRAGNEQTIWSEELIYIDTQNPLVQNSIITEIGLPVTDYVFEFEFSETMDTTITPTLLFPNEDPMANSLVVDFMNSGWISQTSYYITYTLLDADEELADIDIQLTAGLDSVGNEMILFEELDAFSIDTENPNVNLVEPSQIALSDTEVGASALQLTIGFDEPMDTMLLPTFTFPQDDPLASSLVVDTMASMWTSTSTFVLIFELLDAGEELMTIDILTASATDISGNEVVLVELPTQFIVDTKNPTLLSSTPSSFIINDDLIGSGTFDIELVFDEEIDQSAPPIITFPVEDPTALTLSSPQGSWTASDTYTLVFDVTDAEEILPMIDIEISPIADMRGNLSTALDTADVFDIEMRNPEVASLMANTYNVDNSDHGAGGFSLLIEYDEPMNTAMVPFATFPVEDPLSMSLTLNPSLSNWVDSVHYDMRFDVNDITESLSDIDVEISLGEDQAGNDQVVLLNPDFFSIELDSALSLSDLSMPIGNIYPNPISASESLVIEFTEVMDEVHFELIDLKGSTIMSRLFYKVGQRMSIPMNETAGGIYYVRLTADSGNSIFKIVRE